MDTRLTLLFFTVLYTPVAYNVMAQAEQSRDEPLARLGMYTLVALLSFGGGLLINLWEEPPE